MNYVNARYLYQIVCFILSFNSIVSKLLKNNEPQIETYAGMKPFC